MPSTYIGQCFDLWRSALVDLLDHTTTSSAVFTLVKKVFYSQRSTRVPVKVSPEQDSGNLVIKMSRNDKLRFYECMAMGTRVTSSRVPRVFALCVNQYRGHRAQASRTTCHKGSAMTTTQRHGSSTDIAQGTKCLQLSVLLRYLLRGRGKTSP